MKKLTIVSLFIFWAVMTSILTAGLILRGNNGNSAIQSSNQTQSGVGPIPNVKLTLPEISKHDSAADCWLIINNKVYNVTDFLSGHPGGIETIIPYCGKDATAAFNTKDLPNPKPHSKSASSMLDQYYLGDVGQDLPKNQQPSSSSQTETKVQTQIQTQTQSQTVSDPSIQLTLQEVAKHNSQSDCWLIIENKIYGVTNYLNSHPGGVSAIVSYCGKDATQAFNVTMPHSQNAHNILVGFYIGDLNQSVLQQSVQNIIQSSPPPTIRSHDEDDDD